MFTSKPLYFEYVEARGQMISKDRKLLRGSVKTLNKKTATLSWYIYRRIENAKYQKQENKHKYDKNRSQHIRFDTLFDLILTDEEKKIEKTKLQHKKFIIKRDIIIPIFEHHKREKNIKKYKEYDEGIKFEI